MMVLCTAAGLLFGALINLLADQIPLWRRPRRLPFCPYCEKDRPAWAWISVVAYLRARPDCQNCAAPISMRHPLVELGTAMLFSILWLRFGPTAHLALYSLYATILVLIVAIDLEHHAIPDVVIYPAWVVAILGSLIHPVPPTLPSALLGGAIGFGLLFLAHLLGRGFIALMSRARCAPAGRQAFGLGDVRLGGFVGLIVGFPLIFPALLISILLGGLVSLAYLLFQAIIARRYTAFASIAYSPFLSAGALLTILYAPTIETLILLH